MAGQDWSIMIVSSEGRTQFQPDVPNARPGDPLQAQNGDLISWNNRTARAHQPWAIDPVTGEPYKTADDAKAAKMYLSDEVPAWQSSSPAFPTPDKGSTTIDYICKLHEDEDETGQIVVSAS